MSMRTPKKHGKHVFLKPRNPFEKENVLSSLYTISSHLVVLPQTPIRFFNMDFKMFSC